MLKGKVIKTSLCVSAFALSLGFSQEVSATTTVGSDIGIAGITPVMDNYYSSNGQEELGEAEEYVINLLMQLDQENGTNLTEIVSPYANLGISTASSYVNIRTEPNTESEIAGKLYNGCATDILAIEGDWVKIESGNVEGYIKSEYLAIGPEAEELIEEVASKKATIQPQTLYVRQEPNTESSIVTMVPIGEKYDIIEEQEDWAKIIIDDLEGYVSKDYIEIDVDFEYAISIEEEQARIAAEEAARQAEEERLAQLAREEEERKAAQAAAKKKKAASSSKKTTSSKKSTSSKKVSAPNLSAEGKEKGKAIANYAVQFVGNPYRYRGTSLTNGADCSGFVQTIYKQFGYSIPRDSRSQSSGAGYEVSIGDRQPGDLIFYTKNGRVNHVALYIGGGQVVHASSPSSGIKISSYNYRTPYKIRRVVR